MIRKLEWELYRSYECSSRPVLMSPGKQELKSAAPDLYGAHHHAANLQRVVSQLDSVHRWVVESKYGLLPDALCHLADYLMTTFELPQSAAQTFILHWLGRRTGIKLSDLCSVLDVSKATVSRKCRSICLELDEINLSALEQILLEYPLEKAG